MDLALVTNYIALNGSARDTIKPVRRIVLDTNVLVSGLRSRSGASHSVVSKLGTGLFDTVVSVPMLFEYEAVLKDQADALRLSSVDIDEILDWICTISTQQDIYYLWRPALRDPKDECVLELAVAAGCDAIVTHNGRHFRTRWRFGHEVLTPAELLRRIGEESS